MGDYYNDGGGKHRSFFLRSNRQVEYIQSLHDSVPEKLGFKMRDVCGEYEDARLDGNIRNNLTNCGFNMSISNDRYWSDTEDYFMDVNNLLNLWIDILMYLDGDLWIEEVKSGFMTSFYGYGAT